MTRDMTIGVDLGGTKLLIVSGDQRFQTQTGGTSFSSIDLELGGGTLDLNGYEAEAYGAAKQFSLPELWRACSLPKVKAGDAIVALGAMRIAS
jgi:hypothetical protein